MRRTVIALVGVHLFLGAVLLSIEAIHGINDQDPSFVVALLFHYLNLPTIWFLDWMGVRPGIAMVMVVGTVQWAVLAVMISIACVIVRWMFRAITGRTKNTPEPRERGRS